MGFSRHSQPINLDQLGNLVDVTLCSNQLDNQTKSAPQTNPITWFADGNHNLCALTKPSWNQGAASWKQEQRNFGRPTLKSQKLLAKLARKIELNAVHFRQTAQLQAPSQHRRWWSWTSGQECSRSHTHTHPESTRPDK